MEQRACPKCKEFWQPHPSFVFRFCPRCGVRLEQPCPSCHQDLPTLSPECSRCQIRLQICPNCFRLFPLRENFCPFCRERREPLNALRPSFACLRGNAANTFMASPAFLDLLPQQTPSFWEQKFSPPLSMGVLAYGSLLFVSGSERLRLHCWHLLRQAFEVDLRDWAGTDANALKLWVDKSWLWLWDNDNRWLNLIDISQLQPNPMTEQPLPIPEGARIVGAAFGMLWWERENRLEALDAQGWGKELKPNLSIPLTAPLIRFPVDRFSETAFVVMEDAVFFADQQGNIWRWERESQKAEMLRSDVRLNLLPVTLSWRGRREIVWVADSRLLCLSAEGWREVPLTVRPSGNHPVAMGEGIWLPIEKGQRWAFCDDKGIVMAECRLPPQTETLYAFAAETLWLLQRDSDVVRLFRCDREGKVQPLDTWDSKEQPFVFGYQCNSSAFLLALVRRSGKAWAKLCISPSVG